MSLAELDREYPALLSFGYEGDLWVANFSGMPGCWVEGKDREDVIARAPAMLALYLEGCLNSGIDIPKSMDADDMRETGLGEVLMIRPDFSVLKREK